MRTERSYKYLNLFKIRLPLPGIVSIMHRISGLFMFLAIGVLLWGLEKSLESSSDFQEIANWLDSVFVKVVVLGLVWGFFHHLFAGIRFLLLDLHIGVQLITARITSGLVLALGLVTTVLVGIRLW